jgi:phage-related protein
MAIVGTASIRIRAITTGFEAELKRAADKIERTMGRGAPGDLFKFDKKSFGQLAKQSDAVYDSVNGLITKSYFLQAAISGLVPVIGAAGAGLFALGSQAAAATPALVVLPSLLTAIAQAGIVAKMGLGGLFKAVGELGKAKTPSVDQMPAKLAAMASAQQRVDRAQRSLNDAYRTAAERLQQLGFDTEDAAIGQERAAIALEEARETLARVQDLPPNSKARREAELAFREADINYRRAIDRNSDLQEEQDRASKGGTLNGEEQVKQSREVLDAQLELKNAVKSLAKAQLDLKKSQGAGASLEEFKKLSKAGQELAKYLVSIKPEIQKLKDAAGEKLFAPLQDSISNLVDNFFPRLIPIFRDTGEALGKTALDFSKAITEIDNLKNFETVGRTNIDTIGKLGKVLGNLYSAFMSMLAAADPLVRRFTDWVVQLTAGWKESTELKNKTGALTETFKKAGDVAAQLGDIFGNLIGGLVNMGKAASGPGSGGQLIFDALDRNTKKFKKWSETVLKDGSLKEYFKESSNGFLKLAGIIGKIFKIIAKSATQEGTGEFLDSISRAVDTLAVGFERLTGAAPAFGKFIEEFARMTVAFMEAGSIEAFFNTLGKIVKTVADIFENEFVQKVFGVLAVMHGAKLALIVVRSAFKTLGFYLLGMMRTVIMPLKFVFGLLTTTLGLTSAAAIGIIAAVVGLVAVLVLAWKNSKIFRDALADLGGKVLGALSKAFTDIKKTAGDAFATIFGKGTGVKDVFKEIGDVIGKYIVPVFSYLLPKSIEVASIVFQGLINIVAGVAVVIKGVFKIIKGVFALFTGDFSGFLDLFGSGFMDVFGGLGKAIAGIFSSIFAPIRVAFGDIFGAIAEKVAPVARVFKPILDVVVTIAKVVRTVLYVAFLVAFTAIGIVIAETWRLIKRVGTAIIDNIAMPVVKVALPAIKISFGIIKKIFEKTFQVLAIVAGAVFLGVQIAVQLLWIAFKKYFNLMLSFYKYVFGRIKTVFNAVWPLIWGGIQWAYENVIKPYFIAIRDMFLRVWSDIKAAFDLVWPLIWGAISWAYENVIKPVFRKIQEAFEFYWGLIKAAFDKVWPVIWGAISWAWENVIKPTFDKIGEAFGFVWGKIKEVFNSVWDGIKLAFTNFPEFVNVVFGKIGEIFGTVWTGIKNAFNSVWDGIKLAFTNFPEFIKGVWNKAIGFINGFLKKIVEGFKQIPTLIGAVFKGIIDGFKSAINWIIDKFNSTIGGKSFTLPFGGGTFGFGKISPIGGDSKTNWEDVVTGGYRDIPGLALGGTVLPRAGGTLVNVAEAGRAERIEPLDQDGLSKRDKAMIAVLSGGASGGITLNVYPSPGMNEVELAALVNRQLAFQLRRGAA